VDKEVAVMNKYTEIFKDVFAKASSGEIVPYSSLINDSRLPLSVGVQTRKKHLKEFIEKNPSYLKCISGLIPKPETIIASVETEIGPITEDKLDLANMKCSELVNAIARPMVDEFVRDSLSDSYDASSGNYLIDSLKLSQFLLDDFSTYLKAAGNGLVSIAGSLNEKLLHRALVNVGMELNQDFKVTGTDSEADIVIHTSVGTHDNLGVEVKSYHARERLLRGLKDVKEPKVGVGYFKDPSEFNYSRTITLIQSQAAAIYMPQKTLELVELKARGQTVNVKVALDSALYRPLERFASDMKHNKIGKLPHYVN
jgi:hypothetical protein